MVRIEEVDIDVTIPDDGVGIVIMQPYIVLTNNEPFRWQNDKKDKQITRIKRVLDIAMKADHECEKTHFTIFPEYSIPGIEGVTEIERVLTSNDWENGTIVIGGIDGLTKEEYTTFCIAGETGVHEMNKPGRVGDGKWVNCCITWIKNAEGCVKRWIQPKLVPASSEELCPASNMFEGKAVYVFKSKINIQDSILPFRFLSFICKDWIGKIGGSYAIDLVLKGLNDLRNQLGDRLDIYLTLVLKRNNKPNYSLFLQRTVQYITEEICPGVRRLESAILFANNAGKDGPGNCEKFGHSGFVFHPNSSFVSHEKCCPPTYTLKTRKGLNNCKEARFREDGSCILSIKYLLPISSIVIRTASTPMIPIKSAIVHSIDANGGVTVIDPRIPGMGVAASVKWINDELDSIDFILKDDSNNPIRNEIERAHRDISNEIRKNNDEFLGKYIVMASCENKNEKDKWVISDEIKIPNVDNWDKKERKSLETIVHSLDIIKACKPLEVEGSLAHATIKIESKVIDVIVVSGESHEKCFEYAKNGYQGSGQRFLTVITQDKHGKLWDKRYQSILQARGLNSREELYITDPSSRFFQCGYQNVLNCLNSCDINELDSKLTEVMGL